VTISQCISQKNIDGKADVIYKTVWDWKKLISHKRKEQGTIFALILVYLHFRVINQGVKN